MIAHFNRIAEKGYEDEQCLIDDPKAVIEEMTHYAYVLNSDICAWNWYRNKLGSIGAKKSIRSKGKVFRVFPSGVKNGIMES